MNSNFFQSKYKKIIIILITTLYTFLVMNSLSSCSALNDYPLSENGKYSVGYHHISSVDHDREDRKVNITVWYPATSSDNAKSDQPVQDAPPDHDAAPYPLLLSSTKLAKVLAPLVVPYGFVWASVDDIDYWLNYNKQMLLQPMDILFTLDFLADQPPVELEDMIDSENAGSLGYSFDGYNSLALSGARIDPDFYLTQCADPDKLNPTLLYGYNNWGYGALAEKWNSFAAVAGEEITTSADGLWQPITDPRIRAFMPMACDGWLMFGERGLAAVDRPILMIVAQNDGLYHENALIFNQLGTPDRTFITFNNLDHSMILDNESISRIAHFVIAFFGHRLQGQQSYQQYYSENFVNRHSELHFGVVE